jgi:hypothetical protein
VSVLRTAALLEEVLRTIKVVPGSKLFFAHVLDASADSGRKHADTPHMIRALVVVSHLSCKPRCMHNWQATCTRVEVYVSMAVAVARLCEMPDAVQDSLQVRAARHPLPPRLPAARPARHRQDLAGECALDMYEMQWGSGKHHTTRSPLRECSQPLQ